jgi:Tol biopolymer transport system component
VKVHVAWRNVEVERGNYDWTELNKAVKAARENDLGLLVRVDQAPAWAHPSNPHTGAPPDPEYLGDWSKFVQLLAIQGRGRVQAYEIWNEPNLALEWGGQPPDPAGYAQLLRIAYNAIKAGDPQAMVVSAGLAVTQENTAAAMDEVVFLEGLYANGAGAWFDVLGAHPHAGPEGPRSTLFRRLESQRGVMEANGDAGKMVWATEMAWIVHPQSGCAGDLRWANRLWEAVSPEAQSSWLAEAFAVTQADWPWLGGIFVFNLDFSLAPWYDQCEPMAHESLLDRSGAASPAFLALQQMSKPRSAARPASSRPKPPWPVIKGACSNIWALVDGQRRWIPDAGTFDALGYDWDMVEKISPQQVAALPLGRPLPSISGGGLPDGTLLRYPAGHLFLVEAGKRRLVPDAATFEYRGFCWQNILDYDSGLPALVEGVPLPRLDRLAYIGHGPGGPELFATNLDGQEPIWLASKPARFAWWPFTDRLVFAREEYGRSIVYSATAYGQDLIRLTDASAAGEQPTYTPDGQYILYISSQSGARQVWAMAADGSGPRQLTAAPGLVERFSLSADGSRLVFDVQEPDGTNAIWTAGADGQIARRITQPGRNAGHGAISPNGTRIAFVAGPEGAQGIFVVDPLGGAERQIGSPTYQARNPAWSPGGQRIAWIAQDEAGQWSLWVGRTGDNTDTIKALDGAHPADAPSWSGDGAWLAVTLEREGIPVVYIVRPEGYGARPLTPDGQASGAPVWTR